MTITEILNSHMDTVTNTLQSVNAFAELVASKLRNLQEWVSNNEQDDYTAIDMTYDSNDNHKLFLVSRSTYEQALGNPSATFLLQSNVDSSIGSVEFSGEQICDAIEDNIIDLKAQQAYVDYAMNSGEMKISDLLSVLKNKVSGISGNMIEWYSTLVQGTSSPIEALANFFQMMKVQEHHIQDIYVTWNHKKDYQGNAMTVAFAQMSDDLNVLFSAIADAVTHIDQFAEKLIDGLTKLGMKFFGMFFGQLLTKFCKASDAVTGVLDFPIFTYYMQASEFEGIFNDMINFDNAYTWKHTNLYWNFTINGIAQGSTHRITRAFKSLFYDVDKQGNTYKSITQVVIPDPFHKGFGLMLQTGWDGDQTHHMILQGYLVCNYQTFSQYSDNDIVNSIVFDVLENCLKQISGVCPLINRIQDVDDTSIMWNGFVDQEFYPYSSTASELAERIRRTNTYFGSTSTGAKKVLIRGLLMYMCAFGKGFVDVFTGEDFTNDVLLCLYNNQNGYYTPSTSMRDVINQIDVVTDSIFLKNFSSGTFTPYAKAQLLSPTVHYQPVEEQAAEIVTTVYRALFAIAAAIVVAKAWKFIKDFKFNLYTAHAASDAASWTYAANPSTENYRILRSAYVKAKRLDFLSGLFGVMSLEKINSRFQDREQNLADANISSVVTLIKG